MLSDSLGQIDEIVRAFREFGLQLVAPSTAPVTSHAAASERPTDRIMSREGRRVLQRQRLRLGSAGTPRGA
jgi:hypothetical protein